MSFNEDKEEYEAFRILVFITSGQEQIFYIMYADHDEGPEAIDFTQLLLAFLRTFVIKV